MSESILVVRREYLAPYLTEDFGLITEGVEEIVRVIEAHHEFRPRPEMETDPAYKQIIPYVLVTRGAEAFVMQQWAEEVRDASVKKASEIVSGLIMRSLFYLIYNDHDAAVANERMARYIYNKYQKEMGGEARTTLPPYNEMKKTMVETLSKTLNPVMAEILKQRVLEDQAAAPSAGPLKSDQ